MKIHETYRNILTGHVTWLIRDLTGSQKETKMEAALLIPMTEFSRFSASTRTEILSIFPNGKDSRTQTPEDQVETGSDSEEDGPTDLTKKMVREFCSGVSEKTLTVLREIARTRNGNFLVKNLVSKLDGIDDPSSLRGVWAGLTKRVRTITGSADATFIEWIGEGEFDTDDIYLGHEGRVSSLTHASLKHYFKI